MKFLVYVLIFINLGILIWGITGQFTSQEHAGQAPLEFGDVKVLSKYDIDLLRTASNRDSLANTALDGDSNSKLPSQADPTVEQQTKTIPSSSVEALIVQDGVSGAEKGESNVEPRQSQTVGGTEVLTQLVAEEARQTVAAAEHRQEGAAGLGLGEADSVAEKMVTPEDTRTFQSPNAANEERGFPTTETLEPESAQFQEHSEPLQLICNVLGPIEDEVLAKAIFREIERQGGVGAALRTEPLKRVTGYWVVLPTYNDYGGAIDAIKKLKQQGIVDIQRFYRGELKDGVSLGIYNRRLNAEKRKSQIEEKGFSPEILPRYTEIPAFWIDIKTEHSDDLLGRITDHYPALESKNTECNQEPLLH